ncbi:MAG: zinc ribbon domain-containing protein [Methanomassiliicoccus sp.]|nr:zinc ribbon domain-containing protein [Methanomassiliicoccus sp.]
MQNIPFLASSTGPAWLPAAARDARQFAYWGQLITGVMSVIALIMAVVSFVTGEWVTGLYFILAMLVLAFLFYMMGKTVFEPLDQGKFREASDKLLIWGILGLIFLVIPGIFLLLAFVRLQEVFQPQYQQYPTQYYQQPQQYPQKPQAPGQYQAPAQQHPAPPQQYQAPVPPPAAPAPEAPQQQRSEMIKCKNCGVQYPAFMRNCPNCGAPR